MNKKRFWRVFLPVLAFLLLACVLLGLAQALLMPKYMTEIREGAMIAEYYDSVPQHSAVFFGDCEIYNAVNPAVIWEEYGIPTFVRGSAQQLIWHSYYLMEETFARETPEVVVFNAVELLIGKVKKETYTRMTLDGMPLSRYKLAAARESLTPGESLASYVFPILRYHSRWSELTEEDFTYWFHKDPVTFGGYLMTEGVEKKTKFRSDFMVPAAIPDNCWEWLDKIRELCDKNGVQLILFKSPTDSEVYPWFDVWEAKVADYAERYGLRYINAIREAEAIGTDWDTDSCDGGDHLNYIGAEKVSRYLGGILRDEYGLADCRGDAKLDAEWNETVKKYRAAVSAAESTEVSK